MIPSFLAQAFRRHSLQQVNASRRAGDTAARSSFRGFGGRRRELLGLSGILIGLCGLVGWVAAETVTSPAGSPGSASAAAPVAAARQDQDQEPPKIQGHWGEDTIGFRWTEQDSVDGRWQQTVVGPFLSTSIPIEGRPIAKGRVIRVDGGEDIVCYDTLSGLLEGWWRGDDLVRFAPARYGLIQHPSVSGPVVWSREPQADERPSSYQHRSMWQRGEQIVLVGDWNGVRIHESPRAWRLGDGDAGAEDDAATRGAALLRDVRLDAHDQALIWNPSLPLAPGNEWHLQGEWLIGEWRQGERSGGMAVRGRTSDSHQAIDLESLRRSAEAGCWTVPPCEESAEMQLVCWNANDIEMADWRAALGDVPWADWSALAEPSERLWRESFVTRGSQGEDRRGIRMDTIELPFDNSYQALLFLSGIDFLDERTAAICTVHGDVWLVSGLDETLNEVRWNRYATGLFQPLGLKVVDGQVYVLGRDQITRLVDRNSDGEADEYQCFNNQAPTSLGGHDYAACLEVDAAGRFLSVRGNTGVERFAADGSNYELIATGLRNPNGLGVSPSGMITTSPQEGEWTPASSIIVVKEGGHYGYQGPRVNETRPLGYDPPLIWLPRLLDNSCGGQAWLPGSGWDGLNGAMVHLSFGRCWPLLVFPQEVAGQWQGAAVRLPFECESGICRGRAQPGSGHLYLAGLKGWASSSVMDGCLHRLVRTGERLTYPTDVEAVANGVIVRFDTPLDRDTAQDRGRWSAQTWNYRYSQEYGSADYRPSRPAQPGHDELPIRSVTLGEDGRSAFVEMPGIAPVMQLAISYDIESTSGDRLNDTLYQTLHRLPDEQGVPGPHAQDLAQTRDLEQLEPGLILSLRQAAISGEQLRDYRVNRRVALSRFDERVSPWIESRALEAVFEGWWVAAQRETVSLVALGGGDIEVKLGEQWLEPLLVEPGRVEFPPVVLEKGLNELRVAWTSLAEEPERFELLMAYGTDGAVTTIAAERLRHDPLDSRLTQANDLRAARVDFVDHQCHRCHAIPEGVAVATTRMPELDFGAPDLRGIANRVHESWLQAWILDPHQGVGRGVMPALLDPHEAADQQTAADLVAFLTSLPRSDAQGDSLAEPRIVEDRPIEEWVEEGRALVEVIGCVACHVTKRDDDRSRISWEQVGRKFTAAGLIESPWRIPPAAFVDSHADLRIVGRRVLCVGRLPRSLSAESSGATGVARRGRAARETGVWRIRLRDLSCRECRSAAGDRNASVGRHAGRMLGGP
ncbi:MAG: hypothetical protein R3B96_04640 [Pirellulaceae bacterium]